MTAGLRRRLWVYALALTALAVLALDPFHWRAPGVFAVVEGFMAATGIPGGVVALGRIGQAPELRAFGHERGGTAPMRVDAELPLASLSKPLAAAAILRLVARGELSLDQTLASVIPAVGSAADPRYRSITLRDLLQHSGGWDSNVFEPVSDPAAATARLGAEASDCRAIALAMLRLPLDFAPGTRQHYANLGYCWLGMVIGTVTGRPPEDYVEREVLEAEGIRGLHPAAGMVGGLSAARLGLVGGWAGTAAAYYRFAARPWAAAVAPAPAAGLPDGSAYVLGWRRWPDGTLTHFGFLPGVFTIALIAPGGTVVVALFNDSPSDAEALAPRLARALAAAREMHD